MARYVVQAQLVRVPLPGEQVAPEVIERCGTIETNDANLARLTFIDVRNQLAAANKDFAITKGAKT